MNYNDIFKNFYNNSKDLSDSVPNYVRKLEKGISICILKRHLTNNDIPLGIELSAKQIFKILDIDIVENNINLNFFKNYIVVNSKIPKKPLLVSFFVFVTDLKNMI